MATQQTSSLCQYPCVFLTSLEGCYCYEEWCLLTVGPSFKYTIPNFEALAVELLQTRVERTLESGEAERYDAFIRNDSGLSRNYPATVLAKSTFTIEVCMQVDSSICSVCVCVSE